MTGMTARELIERLQEHPPEREVWIAGFSDEDLDLQVDEVNLGSSVCDGSPTNGDIRHVPEGVVMLEPLAPCSM